MKRKILSVLLAAALLIGAGCSSAQPAATAPAETTTTAAETTPAETTPAQTEETETAPAETEETAADEESGTDAAAAAFYDGALTPAVWKVTDPESGNSMHMMGTIHIIPDREPVVPDYVTAIYEAADGIAVEYDTTKINTDFVVQIQYLNYFILSDGTTIGDHLSADLIERAGEAISALGYDPAQLTGYNAAYWDNLLSSGSMLAIEGMRPSGIDVSFIMSAKRDGKEVRSIEALDDQLSVLTMLSDEFYEWEIGELLETDPKEFEDSLRELYAAWAAGDTALFDEAEAEESEEVPPEFAEEYAAYSYALCQNRNIGMAEKAAEYLQNGDNLFYMVGFAHFCGEGNVLSLLEERGFTVERLY